jgi:hypothetical protein
MELPRSASARYHVSSVGMVNQIKGYGFDAVRPDQAGRFGFELWQLEDGNFRRIVHMSEYTAMRYIA